MTVREQRLKVALSCLMADVKNYFAKHPDNREICWPSWFDESMIRAAEALQAYDTKREQS